MKVKLIVVGVVAFLSFPGGIFASEGHARMEHKGSMMGSEQKGSMMESEHKGSMMEDEVQGVTPASPKPIEVGNKICPVSGQDVGSMGGAVQSEYEGKIYTFCCSVCVESFRKDPEKYVKIVEDMMKEEIEVSAEAASQPIKVSKETEEVKGSHKEEGHQEKGSHSGHEH